MLVDYNCQDKIKKIEKISEKSRRKVVKVLI